VSQDGTSILFGLRGVKVRGVERGPAGHLQGDAHGDVHGWTGRVVHVLTDDPSEGACPTCGVVSASVRQRRTTRPRDLPYGEDALVVRWHKTQWSCRERACARKAFTDQVAELPAGARVTGRLRRHVAARVADGLAVSVAGGALLSWPISHAAWVSHAKELLAEPAPVVVLGVDETRRGRPVWRQDPVTSRWVVSERFETNFVDLAGEQGLLGQTAGRTRQAVTAWLDERGQAWKDSVQVVAMDPCASYRAAVREALPQARIVADHFHLVRLANQAVTEVRRRMTWDSHSRRGRKTDPAWAARRRLLRGWERLSPAQFANMWNDLMDGDPSTAILTAWIAKKSSANCSRPPPRAVSGTTSRTGCTASTTGARSPGSPSSSAWRARSRHGGLRSWGSCRPASSTPAPRPPTAPSRPPRAPPTASETSAHPASLRSAGPVTLE